MYEAGMESRGKWEEKQTEKVVSVRSEAFCIHPCPLCSRYGGNDLLGGDNRLRLVLQHRRVAVHEMRECTQVLLVEEGDRDLGCRFDAKRFNGFESGNAGQLKMSFGDD
jgi:hypothetical protein